MNKFMRMWPLMAEADNPGGGADPAPAADPKPAADPAPAADPKPAADPNPAADPKPDDLVNLMDDDPNEPKEDQPKPPTEEEVKAWREGIKATDLGDGVTFDDAALDAMTAPLMKLTGGDPKKGEELVKAYTDFRRAEAARAQEQSDAFVRGLVQASKERFGADLKGMVALAKDGGKKIFGDALWNQMKSVPQFANNPDIIERLAAFGKSVKDDPGATKNETGTEQRSGGWRENMYGPKN